MGSEVKGVEVWTLEQIQADMESVYSDKPANYVSCELTEFVGRHVDSVQFFKLSPKKTVCLLTFKNGFEVIGYSGCVNPKHYRRDIGSKYALHTAVDKASEIIAYQEQEKLFNSPGTESYDKPA
jgi:hypothetical protein